MFLVRREERINDSLREEIRLNHVLYMPDKEILVNYSPSSKN